MARFTRRQFIITAGAAATTSVLVHGCASGSSSNDTSTSNTDSAPAANVSAADTPEVTTAKLGFIALTDSAPLIIALEKGLFKKYGMTDVKVEKQASWPVTRDNLELGS
ncbi:MAG TPA: bicarbonate-binding protein, partial [Cyanobacteria bacterium UBA12227]|nr:bicarbonate-binding protein [Cyanobacteria bacterium UBA12227]